jgi:hypothetical protein
MVARSFLSPATATKIKTVLRARGFTTRLAVQDPSRSIALDRGGVALPAQQVVIVWAKRQPTRDGSATVDVLGVDGELQAWQELDAQPDDLFMLDGHLCEITSPVVVDAGVARAGFRLTHGEEA